MNQYNPNIHHRRSIRLKGYDYSQAGLYFITICCQDRICRFGEVKNGEMILNELGEIAHNEWIKLTERFTHFELDVFQIMPNHMHGIILLNDIPVGSGFTPDLKIEGQPKKGQPRGIEGQPRGIEGQPQGIAPTGIIPTENDIPVRSGFTPDLKIEGQPQGINPTIGDIVGAYKSLVANGCLKIYKSKNEIMGKLWQRNYWEHIIRDEKSYYHISNYIINNPQKWQDDKFYK